MRKFLALLMCVVVAVGQLNAQSRSVSGTITDANGKPVLGATVLVRGSKGGTTTDADGHFTVTVPASAKALIISAVGFAAQTVNIAGESTISLKLVAADNGLQEVVVVGYQSVKKKELIGSVSTVSPKEIQDKPIASFTQLLQGKATGVQVVAQSGRPGQNAYIRIRGTGSINASNEPLIIIDGIAVSSAAYNLLNPNDIEDISVLKDAASAAIYGSRAGNGVIVITTKRGHAGKSELKYSFQYGRSKTQDLKNVTLMNSQQKLQYEYEGGYTNPILDTMISARYPVGTTLNSLTDPQRQSLWDLASSRGAGNWRKYLLTDAPITKQEVDLTGGSDRTTYYMSLTKRNEQGTLYGSFFNSYSGRLNLESRVNDWFKVGVNLGVSQEHEKVVRELFNSQNAYAALFLYNPYEPVRTADGKYNNTFQGFSALEGADNNPVTQTRVTGFSTVYGEARFLKYLTLKSQIGINYNTLEYESYLQPGSNLANILGYSQKNDQGNQDFNMVFSNTAGWAQTVGKHSFNLLAGTEFIKDRLYSYSLTSQGFPTASVNTLDNGGLATVASTSRSDYALISYFATAGYNYDKKYFITVTGRRDGSSRFGKAVRFGNFWSVGGAWDVKAETFADRIKVLSTLKVRASIGTSGNQPTGLYTSLGTYSLVTKYNDVATATPLQLPNPDFTWEENKNWDMGLDFGFIDNRIEGTLDYYNRQTNNLIYPVNVSYTTGFANYTGNVGNIRNSGIELGLQGDVIRKKDLTWSLNVSYTHNTNKVLQLYSDNVTATLSKLKVGEPLNVYYMPKWAGVNPQDGKNQFYNADGTVTETFNATNQTVVNSGKSPLAKFYGAFGTTVKYKDFDFSAQFYYSGGNYIMNYVWQVAADDGEDVSIPHFTEAENYWKKVGDNTRYANLKDASQNITYDTDKYLEKGDYVSLRDVTIGYSIPMTITNRLKFLKGMHFYVQGTNLLLFTKYHGIPEVGQANSETSYIPGQATLYGYPQLRAFTVGANIRF